MKRRIDNLYTLIYNYIIILFHSARKRINLAFLALVITLFLTTSASASGPISNAVGKMSISAVCESGKLTATLTLPTNLRGFVGELEFDSSSFTFAGASVSENSSYCLTYAEKNGKILFLLDSGSSEITEAETVSFFFDYLKEDEGLFAFSVYPLSNAYFYDGNELFSREILPFGIATACQGNKTSAVVVSSEIFSAELTDGNLLVSCIAEEISCLFAGIDVSIVDLEDHTVENFSLFGTLPSFSENSVSRFLSFNISVPQGRVTVIITPKASHREGENSGKRSVCYFSDHKLVE